MHSSMAIDVMSDARGQVEARQILAQDMSSPPGVQQGTEFIESYADVLKSESCAKLLKLSDKVTLTRAFTARWKNRPVIVFFHRVSPIPFFKNVHTILKKHWCCVF